MLCPASPRSTLVLLGLVLAAGCADPSPYRGLSRGPSRGQLLLSGGGGGGFTAFIDVCGADASFVVVVTASEDGHASTTEPSAWADRLSEQYGLDHVHVAHTRDPVIANQSAFVEPFAQADCVWFSGGRQWRLADAYLGTAVHQALRDLLASDGWVGGDSAGATMMADVLVRGDTSGNTILIGDHTEGFGLIEGVAVDQHVRERGRELDLVPVVDAHPELLGIGLDERTWITVRRDNLSVGGEGTVWISDRARWPRSARVRRRHLLRLHPGDDFDLSERERLAR